MTVAPMLRPRSTRTTTWPKRPKPATITGLVSWITSGARSAGALSFKFFKSHKKKRRREHGHGHRCVQHGNRLGRQERAGGAKQHEREFARLRQRDGEERRVGAVAVAERPVRSDRG